MGSRTGGHVPPVFFGFSGSKITNQELSGINRAVTFSALIKYQGPED
jgi:hypothetical protein